MVSVRTKKNKAQKLTYAQRVIGAVDHLQKEHRTKQALHLASIRAQVRKIADARNEKLGPQWAQHVNKAVSKLEEDGVLHRAQDGYVMVTDDGKKSITSARRSIPHTQSTEDVVWQYISHNPPSASVGPQQTTPRAATKRNRSSISPRKRARISSISTHGLHNYDQQDDDMSIPSSPVRPPGGRRKSVRISMPGSSQPLAYTNEPEDEDEDPSHLIIPIPGVPSTSSKVVSRLTKPELQKAVLHLHRLSLGIPSQSPGSPSRDEIDDDASHADADGDSDTPDRPMSPLTDIDSPPGSPRSEFPPPLPDNNGTDGIRTRPSSPIPIPATTVHLPSPTQTSPSVSPANDANGDAVGPSPQPITRTLSGSLISPFSHQPTPIPSLPPSPTSHPPSLPSLSSTKHDDRDAEIAKLKAALSELASEKEVADGALESARTLSAEKVQILEARLVQLRGEFDLTSKQLKESEQKILELNGSIDSLQEANLRTDALNEELLKERDGLSTQLKKVSSETGALDSEVAKLKEALDQKDKQLKSVRNEHSTLISQLFETKQELGEASIAKGDLEAQVNELLQLKSQLSSSLEVLAAEGSALTAANNELQTAKADLSARLEAANLALMQRSEELSHRSKDVETLQEQLTNLRTQLDESQALATSRETQLGDLRHRVEEGQKQLGKAAADLTEAQSELTQKTNDVNALNVSIVSLEGRITELEVELAARSTELVVALENIASSDNEVKRLQDEAAISSTTTATLQTNIQSLQDDLEEAATESQRKSKEAMHLQSELDRVNKDLSDTSATLASTQSTLSSTQSELETSKVQLTLLNGEVATSRATRKQDAKTISELKRLLRTTRETQNQVWEEALAEADNLAGVPPLASPGASSTSNPIIAS
ncbi:hypothetical protein ONZ45_g2954 [Pleurotus djamor]|nr:hypothetical protein ONZ45_g2954 [Pleurotus djamor]